jgi:dTMP kinase
MENTNQNLPEGLFVVFEGIDGTGKSTQINLLAEKLRRLGLSVISTYEPTDGP